MSLSYTVSKYVKALSINNEYTSFFNLGSYFLKRNIFLLRVSQVTIILLLPFNLSYHAKYIILQIQNISIWVLNIWDKKALTMGYDRRINNSQQTVLLKELLEKIRKCKKLLKKNEQCPEMEAECNELTKEILASIKCKTDLKDILQEELDFIHSRNLSFSPVNKDSIHEMKVKRNLALYKN